jgi:hypothetical protein
VRTLTFVPIAGGFFALLAGLIVGERGGGLRAIRETIGAEPVEQIAPRRMAAIASEQL